MQTMVIYGSHGDFTAVDLIDDFLSVRILYEK